MVGLSKLGGIFLSIKWGKYAIEATQNTYQIKMTTVCIVRIHSLAYGLTPFQGVSQIHITFCRARDGSRSPIELRDTSVKSSIV